MTTFFLSCNIFEFIQLGIGLFIMKKKFAIIVLVTTAFAPSVFANKSDDPYTNINVGDGEKMSIATPKEILDFWFSQTARSKWFAKDPAFDSKITQKFLSTYQLAKQQDLDWPESPESYLALVILFDQFPRNIFRNKPEAFATDSMARDIAKKAIAKGFDSQLSDEHRKFFYMPFMHSEKLSEQEYSVELFTKLGNNKYAILHRQIIERFGRFPHRNEILERQSTEAELKFLKEPGSKF